MYRYGFSEMVGVLGTVVYVGKLWPGTPVAPTKTIFQFEPGQLPNWLLRRMYCCWLPEVTWPVTTEWPMRPPEDQPLSERASEPLTSSRRIGVACEVAQTVLPEDGEVVRFSAPRQKLMVALP